MAVPFSSDEVVEKVRDITSLPDAHWLTTAKLLAFADEEVESLLAARVKTARENHWLKADDLPIVQGTLRYRIPRRALGRAFHSVALASLSSGGVTPLSEIDPALASSFVSGSWNARDGYYVEDDVLVFPVQPPAGYSIRVRYLRRPSRLVPVASAWKIRRWQSDQQLEAEGANPTPLFPASYMDIVRGDAPFDLTYTDLKFIDYDFVSDGVWIIDLEAAALVASSFVNLVTIPNDRADYLCLRDQTVYPQLPAELFPTLVSAVARRVLEAIGDRPGAEIAQASMRERAAAASAIIEPRDQDRSRPIVNRFSPLRGGAGRGYGRWSR